MATEQKADLRQSVSDLKNAEVIRKEDAAEYREELQETVSDLKDASNALIADFVVQHQNRAAELNAYLEDAETERKANSAVLKAETTEFVTNLKNQSKLFSMMILPNELLCGGHGLEKKR